MLKYAAILCFLASVAVAMNTPQQGNGYSAPPPPPPQQMNSYSAPPPPPPPQQVQSYSAPAPVPPPQQSNGYSQQQAPAQNVDPVALLVNTCKVGMVQPIFRGAEISETYCRCPTGTYGIDCSENIPNPCEFNDQQYFPASSLFSASYFIECTWGIPYLFVCPDGLIWKQEITTCDWPQSYYEAVAPAPQQSNGYSAPPPQQVQSYSAPPTQPPKQVQSYSAPPPPPPPQQVQSYSAPEPVPPPPQQSNGYSAPPPPQQVESYSAPAPVPPPQQMNSYSAPPPQMGQYSHQAPQQTQSAY